MLDVNVLVSALLSRTGTPATLLREWLNGAFELVVSPRLLDELAGVLAYPKIRTRVEATEAEAFLQLLATRAQVGLDSESAAAHRSADPDDDYLIALAASAQAMLVSGDSHLLSLANRIPVFTAAAFLRQLS